MQKMNKKIYRQIFTIAALTTPIIALLIASIMNLVANNSNKFFFTVWSLIAMGITIGWLIQTPLFSFFKNKGYQNWQYLLFLLTFILVGVYFQPLSSNAQYIMDARWKIYSLNVSVGAAVNLIIFVLLDLIYTKEHQIRLTSENAALKFNNLEAKYSLLKEQINPHFLFNALNISKSLIRTRPKDAEKYIIQLSDFLRLSLNNQEKSISLKKELTHCNQYISLQKVRFGAALNFSINIDDSYLNNHIPFFTLITLVENAIKHNSFTEEVPLNIFMAIQNDFLVVKNNLNIKQVAKPSKKGLANLNQRSTMLSHNEIIVENDGQYFTVKVKLIQNENLNY